MEQISTKVAEYNAHEATLAEMRKLFAGKTYDVTTKEGMAEARKDRYGLRTLRTKLEAKRKEIKEPVLVQARLIDSEAQRITKEIVALEDPIDAVITVEEKKIEEAKAAAARAEQERKEAEERARKEAEEKRLADDRAKLEAERAEFERKQADARAAEEKAKQEREQAERAAKERAERLQNAMSEIQGIRQQSIIAQVGRAGVRVGGTVSCIEETLAETEAWPVDAEQFGEYAPVAAKAKAETVAQIKQLLAAARARADQEAALKAERDKLDADRRAKEEAEHQAKLAAEREAEEKARAERERVAAEQAAAAERERQAREQQEAAEREQRRQDAEHLDARQHLEAFVERFGHLAEYGFIVVAIKTYLDKNPARKAA